MFQARPHFTRWLSLGKKFKAIIPSKGDPISLFTPHVHAPIAKNWGKAPPYLRAAVGC
jgi:hypothetical protein